MAAEHLLELDKRMVPGLDMFSNCVKNAIASVSSLHNGDNCHLKIGILNSGCLKLEKDDSCTPFGVW